MIHDIEPKHLYNEWKPNAVPKRSSAVVQFCGRNLLCRIDDNGLKLPSRAMFPDGDERFTYLFELDGREYYLLRDETPREPDGWTYRDINIFRTEQPKEIAFAAVSAWHLCCWYRDTRFCGRCGTPLEHDVNERMMHCHHMLERGLSLGMEATEPLVAAMLQRNGTRTARTPEGSVGASTHSESTTVLSGAFHRSASSSSFTPSQRYSPLARR